MTHQAVLYYLIFINLVSGFTFSYDKNAAIKAHRRVPERTLHLLELSGGVFLVWVLMYLLRHKNRKFSYNIITYLILSGWVITGWFIESSYGFLR
jgi:Predicted membrane protein